MDKAQHSAGKTILDSVQLGDLPGIGMTIIDGIVRTHAQPQHAAGDQGAGDRRALSAAPGQLLPKRTLALVASAVRFDWLVLHPGWNMQTVG